MPRRPCNPLEIKTASPQQPGRGRTPRVALCRAQPVPTANPNAAAAPSTALRPLLLPQTGTASRPEQRSIFFSATDPQRAKGTQRAGFKADFNRARTDRRAGSRSVQSGGRTRASANAPCRCAARTLADPRLPHRASVFFFTSASKKVFCAPEKCSHSWTVNVYLNGLYFYPFMSLCPCHQIHGYKHAPSNVRDCKP